MLDALATGGQRRGQMSAKQFRGIKIRLWHGASSAYPVFRSNEKGEWLESKRYRFDTYGDMPSNYKKWKAQHLGAGGAFGETDDLSTLIFSLREQNKRGFPAMICDTLWKEAKAGGAIPTRKRDLI